MRILALLIFTSIILPVQIVDAIVEEHGFMPEKAKIEKVEIGQSPADVLEILGSPSLEDRSFVTEDTKNWYYVKDIVGIGMLGNEYSLEGSSILIIRFANNKVSKIQSADLKTSKRKIRNLTATSKPDTELKESGFDIDDMILLKRMQ